MDAVSVSKLPTVMMADVLFRDTPVTATLPLPPPVTVTVQLAVLLPSAVITVMVALPADTAVTVPFWETEAMLELLLLHETF
jgi:hypothetical protein